MTNLLHKAYEIAEKEDVSTLPDRAVVYSVSYMPDSENKKRAEDFVKSTHDARMLDDTPCGRALIALGLDGRVDEVGEEITKIWKLASSRYIGAASGNINALVYGADERSTFCSTELHEIINNPKITSINGIAKTVFAQNFQPAHYK